MKDKMAVGEFVGNGRKRWMFRAPLCALFLWRQISLSLQDNAYLDAISC